MSTVAMTTDGAALRRVVLRVSDVVKAYPGTVALAGATFEVREGAVNVLVGENGAGKSTMMKIIAGVERPDAGELVLDGRRIELHGTDDARRHGIGIVFQELNLFPNLSIVENIFIGHEFSRGFRIDRQRQEARARELLGQLEHRLDVLTPVGELRIGEQQIVEIAKALSQDVRILILDEPTSALSAPEVDILFRVISELRTRGVAIVYISHRLEELIRIGDYITVLREGRITGASRMADVDVQWIVQKMVGARQRAFASASEHRFGNPLLDVQNVSLPRGGAPGFLVDDVSFSVRSGEIVGIYGLMGAGRTELLECILGRHRQRMRGTVRLGDRPLTDFDIAECIAAGLALIPEDRKTDGLVHSMSVAENMTLACLRRLARWGQLRGADERAAVHSSVKSLGIKVANVDLPIGSLSGGNQQKSLIGRALLTKPRVLLMDEPSRGIDIGAKAEVFHLMRELAASGLAIVFVTSDLEEVMALSDRILVMSQGRLTAQFDAEEATQAAIVSASAIGHGLAA
jgi:erythritol transport system ATP-binding protein